MEAIHRRHRFGFAIRSTFLAAALVAGTVAAPPARAAVPESRFYWDSQRTLGIGTTGKITSADAGAEFGSTATPPVNVANVAFVQVNAAAINPWWSIYLAGPGGTRIAPGTYLNAADPFHATASQPIMLVLGSLGDCGYVGTGAFSVLAVSFDADGAVTSLAADFSYHCASDTGMLHAQLRFKSAIPATGLLQDPSTAAIDFGDAGIGPGAVQPIAFHNVGETTVHLGTASVGGPQASSFHTANDTCSGTTLAVGSSCSLQARFDPDAVGPATATLSIPNDTPTGGRTLDLTAYGLVATTLTLQGPAGIVYWPATAHMTAQLSPPPGQVGGPDAQIAFRFDNVNYWAPIEADGSASVDIEMRVPGTQSVTAIFASSHELGLIGSTSAEAHVAVRIGTTAQIFADINPAVSTQTVSVLASVTTEWMGGLPGGTFTLTDSFDGSTLGSVDLAQTSQITVAKVWAIGSHDLTAHYSGFGLIGASTAHLTLTVTQDVAVLADGFGQLPATFYPFVDGYYDTSTTKGTLHEPGTVTVSVASVATGQLVRTVDLGTRSGAYAWAWDGRVAGGAIAPAGGYLVTQTIEDTGGNVRKVTKTVSVSLKRLSWHTVTITLPGDRFNLVNDPGNGFVSKARSSYSHGVRIASGNRTAGVGYAFAARTGVATAGLWFAVQGRTVGGQRAAIAIWHPVHGTYHDAGNYIAWLPAGKPFGWYASNVPLAGSARDGKVRGIVVVAYRGGASTFDIAKVRITYRYATLV